MNLFLGLYAPSRGGLDILDLRHGGTVLRTLIPKIAEGIFTVICKFNATNEYVLYYHSGRKTLRYVHYGNIILWVVEFSKEGYKIRLILAKNQYPQRIF